MVYFVHHGFWDKLKRNLEDALNKLGCTEVSSLEDDDDIYVWGKLPFNICKPYIRFRFPKAVYWDYIYAHLAESIDPSDAGMSGYEQIWYNDNYVAHGYLITALPNETFVFKSIGYEAGYGILITAVDGFDGKTYCYVHGNGRSYMEYLFWDTDYESCALRGIGYRQVALDGRIKASDVLVDVHDVYFGVAKNIIYVDFGSEVAHYAPILKVGNDYYDLFRYYIGYKVNTTIETVD